MDENLAKIRHDRSVKDFPDLRLEEDEYVEFAFRRANVCLMLIIFGVGLGLIVVLLAFLLVLLGQSMIDETGRNFLYIILSSLLAATAIIGLVALKVHNGNRLFITNKHAIQMVMDSPMVHSINIIDLSSIEDASFRQDSIKQHLFRYGTFRLSTIGDETTYTFKYSDISGAELKAITDLISKAKKRHKKKIAKAAEDEEEN